MNLYIVRHGETFGNTGAENGCDTHLTENGKKQAECLGNSLRDICFDKIYSSHLTRAVQTAAVIAGFQQKKPCITVVPEFAERGTPFEFEADAEFHKYVYDNIHYTGTSITGNYSGDIERVQEALNTYVFRSAYSDASEEKKRGKDILKTNPENVLIVAHGGINAVILSCLVGFRFDINMNIVQENTCVNRFELFLHNGVPRVKFIAYNDISHLPPALRISHP